MGVEITELVSKHGTLSKQLYDLETAMASLQGSRARAFDLEHARKDHRYSMKLLVSEYDIRKEELAKFLSTKVTVHEG